MRNIGPEAARSYQRRVDSGFVKKYLSGKNILDIGYRGEDQTSVPHKYLYERKSTPPSLFNPDHKRFYTAASLLREFEESLPPNGFRIRHLAENDFGFDYATPIGEHARGCYEIELVVEKIHRPT